MKALLLVLFLSLVGSTVAALPEEKPRKPDYFTWAKKTSGLDS